MATGANGTKAAHKASAQLHSDPALTEAQLRAKTEFDVQLMGVAASIASCNSKDYPEVSECADSARKYLCALFDRARLDMLVPLG